MSDSPDPQDSFDARDRKTLIGLSVGLILFVTCFFAFVWALGLISFPEDRLQKAFETNQYDYFGYALEYRERRLALALTYRTYITSFGFIVGLVMATVGGLFILRRATAAFDASVGSSTAGSQPWSFSLGTNSPGIIFMLAGAGVMVATQFFAIQVGAPEIFPIASDAQCHPSQVEDETCYLNVASTGNNSSSSGVDLLSDYCTVETGREPDPRCADALSLTRELQ